VSSDSNGNVISSTEYSYDKRDRIKSIKQSSNTSAGDKNCNNNKEFTYNDWNWLIKEDVTDLSNPPNTLTSTVYTYDCLGNITSRQINDGSGNVQSNMTYNYNTTNQLTSMLDTLSNVTTTFTYDLNGNMLTMDDGSGTVKKFTVNELNQLTEYNDGKGTNVCYAYNASGLRSQKSQAENPGTYINYYYSPNGSLLNEEDNTNVMSSYLTAGSRASRTIVNGATTQWYISNGKDMVATIANNADGTLTSSNVYNYGAYGKDSDLSTPSSNSQTPTANSFNITDNPFKYSSYYLDAESGLYYLGARYYSPELMKFISMDTYDLANKYAYGNGDPIANVDPSGHSAERIVAGVVFGLMGAAAGIMAGHEINKGRGKAGAMLAVAAGILEAVAAVSFGMELIDHKDRTSGFIDSVVHDANGNVTIRGHFSGTYNKAMGVENDWGSGYIATKKSVREVDMARVDNVTINGVDHWKNEGTTFARFYKNASPEVQRFYMEQFGDDFAFANQGNIGTINTNNMKPFYDRFVAKGMSRVEALGDDFVQLPDEDKIKASVSIEDQGDGIRKVGFNHGEMELYLDNSSKTHGLRYSLTTYVNSLASSYYVEYVYTFINGLD